MSLPLYLAEKLKSFNIYSIDDINQIGYCQVFAILRDKYPNTSYKTLYDLYCLSTNLPINSIDKPLLELIKKAYKNTLPFYTPLEKDTIKHYLDLALMKGLEASSIDEIPIGAVIVRDNQVIATGYNITRTKNNITNHAEIIALTKAQQILGSPYLSDCDLYVTIEPCLMCSGAIIASRVKRLIYGANSPKTGAVSSQYQVFDNNSVNHHTQVIGPVNNKKYSSILSQFLKSKR